MKTMKYFMTMKILFEFVSQFFEYEYFKLGILFVGHSVYVPLNEILFQGEWGGGGRQRGLYNFCNFIFIFSLAIVSLRAQLIIQTAFTHYCLTCYYVSTPFGILQRVPKNK